MPIILPLTEWAFFTFLIPITILSAGGRDAALLYYMFRNRANMPHNRSASVCLSISQKKDGKKT